MHDQNVLNAVHGKGMLHISRDHGTSCDDNPNPNSEEAEVLELPRLCHRHSPQRNTILERVLVHVIQVTNDAFTSKCP